MPDDIATIEELRSVIWYIEVRKSGWPDAGPQMGTAVAIRLKERNTGVLKSFLLTAAHTLRENDWGPLLGEVLCWPHGRGYTSPADVPGRSSGRSPGALTATISSIVPVANEVPVENRRPALDWALLEVKEPAFQDHEAVRGWGIASDTKPLNIAGYPGGAIPWKTGDIVQCIVQRDFRADRLGPPGTLRLNGPGTTAGGMSGGAVFDAHGHLVGIHRAQTQIALAFDAVDARNIRTDLSDKGWDCLMVAPLRDSGAPLQPSTERARSSFELRVLASEIEYDAKRGLLRRPLAGLKIGFYPHRFNPKTVTEGTTDLAGLAKLNIETRDGTQNDDVQGYLLCAEPPAHLAARAPLITDRYAAVQQAGAVTVLGGPLSLAWSQQLQVDVVPYAERGRYYQVEVTDLLDRFGAEKDVDNKDEQLTEVPAGDTSVADALGEIGRRLQVEPSTLAAELGRRITAERPAFQVGAPMVWESQDLEPFVNPLLPAIMGLTVEGFDGVGGAGVIVAKDTLLTVDFINPKTASSAVNAGVRSFEVRKELWRGRGLALFALDSVDVDVTPLAAAPPYVDPTGRKIVVVGYPGRDERLPSEIREEVYGGVFGVKRVMPGNLLPLGGAPAVEGATLAHDAMTSGGVAGGPVIDLLTGTLLGIHRGGLWMGSRKRNFANAMWDLLEDGAARAILEQRGANIVTHETPKRAVARAESIPLPVPYRPDFLGSLLVPLPRLRPEHAARGGSRVLDYVHFSLVFDDARGHARYVACNVDRSSMKRIPRRGDRWLLDPRIASDRQPNFDLFEPGQWDRGHLITPSAVSWGEYSEAQRANRSAFYLTNVVPQVPVFNRTRWNALEQHVFHELHPEARRLCVFAGPVPKNDDLVQAGRYVPRSFWMLAVFGGKTPAVAAYRMDQFELDGDGDVRPITTSVAELEQYRITPKALNAMTGLKFELGAVDEE